ncbi:hypothetical protein AB3M93_13375 [Novosphingobium panipatense]|jgi:hypothetical protein|uniref:hypothetical protein n=1 Tax=Novosphingobium panipatense TaxID=428991 RepID=UPI00399FC7B7
MVIEARTHRITVHNENNASAIWAQGAGFCPDATGRFSIPFLARVLGALSIACRSSVLVSHQPGGHVITFRTVVAPFG